MFNGHRILISLSTATTKKSYILEKVTWNKFENIIV